METQEFKTKVQAIGEALKMSVILGSDEDMRWNKFAHLIGSDGQEIQVQNGDYKTKNRLNFFGCFPKNEKGEHMHYGALPSITVAVEKSPEKIARDIEKRLLPIYLPELEKAIEQVEQSNKYHQSNQ